MLRAAQRATPFWKSRLLEAPVSLFCILRSALPHGFINIHFRSSITDSSFSAGEEDSGPGIRGGSSRPRRFHARSDYFTIKIRKLPDKELYAEAGRSYFQMQSARRRLGRTGNI